ncbi:MAG: tRNA (adenosine(37)-N6)-dimethylallyltransferase MiaA [Clostridia bacterium]|nr:tRNA (adenosine(37)-N6)-dimethylallyltransferase MiaA [Clostridia bacterium]
MENTVCKCLAVVGATASGKTALAIDLARAMGGEIISCDSMQIYRHMDIGTAKPTVEEQAAAPHHMIDILSPTEPFSAADYATRAEACALAVASRGALPIFCGGTGLYLEAVRSARHGEPMESDGAFRAEMQALAEREGALALHARLAAIDPEAAEATHPNNVKRVIRALEIYHLTGRTKTETDRLASSENPRLRILTLFLDFSDRALLYRRIDERVEAMVAAGLFEETERLYREGLLVPGTTAAGAIGYKECLGAVLGTKSREEAIEELKVATHHYAKRQKTWFSAHPHVRIGADAEGALRPREDLLAEAIAHANAFLSE